MGSDYYHNPLPSRPIQRERVYEHRVNFQHNFLIRMWIESDPEYNGIKDPEEAWMAAKRAYQEVFGKSTVYPKAKMAIEKFFAIMPSLNSIELTDERGNGFAAHRDWP